jgi:lysophospholipase L1-like esterase
MIPLLFLPLAAMPQDIEVPSEGNYRRGSASPRRRLGTARPATYPKWAQDVAAAEAAPFIDLHELIAKRYDGMGETAVDPLFADEHTHTTRAGAELNADIVAEALRPLLK